MSCDIDKNSDTADLSGVLSFFDGCSRRGQDNHRSFEPESRRAVTTVTMVIRVAVTGAGVVGLTSAVNVQKLLPDAKVTIIADKFDKDTTSTGAGGIFRPTAHLVKGVPPSTIKAWVQDTWDFFSALAVSAEAKESGCRLLPGYVVSDDPARIQNPLYQDIVINFKILTPEDMKKLKLPFKYGSSFTTVIAHPKKFMPWLMRQFREKGGTVDCRTVNRLEELAPCYDIVVNCCGLGAEKLLDDRSMYPVRGQLELVKAPWLKYFLCCDSTDPTYILPHDDYVIVGGTREKGDYDLSHNKQTQEAILSRAQRIMPQIKAAEHVGSWVGLRPSRDPLRLEKELKMVNGKKLRVVHNYGHGADGVTLSWGTSLRVASMAQEWARDIRPSSRL